MSWGSAGAGEGQFNCPRGLSVDEMGNVYGADRNSHRMQMFTGTGGFLVTWGSFGAGEGQFNFPYAVRAGGRGFVYVNDSSNHRIQKFGPGSCPWDLTGDGTVGVGDLLQLFANWGTPGPGDFNEDGTVGVGDMLIMFANWGPCP